LKEPERASTTPPAGGTLRERVLARASALGERLRVPDWFHPFIAIQTAWALETGRLDAGVLEETLAYCLGNARDPAAMFASRVKACFAKSARQHRGRPGLGELHYRGVDALAQLRWHVEQDGIEWDQAWEPKRERKPR